MTTTVGAFDAKTHLSNLLDRAAAGEDIVITKYGRPVARLVAMQPPASMSPADAVRQIRERRQHLTLGGLDWKELVTEGRR